MIKIIRPNFIFIIIEVMKDMNNIRRSFLGDKRGSPKFPQEIKKKAKIKLEKEIERDFLIPIHFSIIKKPVSIYIEGEKNPRTSTKGVGVVLLYEYMGSSEELEQIMDVISEFFDNKIEDLKEKESTNWMTAISDYKIILGKDYSDIK